MPPPFITPPPGEQLGQGAAPDLIHWRVNTMESWLNPKNFLGLLSAIGVLYVGVMQYVGKPVDPQVNAFVKGTTQQAKDANVPTIDQKAVNDLASQVKELVEALKAQSGTTKKTSFVAEREAEVSDELPDDLEESPFTSAEPSDIDQLKSNVAVLQVNLARVQADVFVLKSKMTQPTGPAPAADACSQGAVEDASAGHRHPIRNLLKRLFHRRGGGC